MRKRIQNQPLLFRQKSIFPSFVRKIWLLMANVSFTPKGDIPLNTSSILTDLISSNKSNFMWLWDSLFVQRAS
jgi:hypothetical protein